jgi:nucleoside-diphosphate-sugar epimerase
MFRVFQASKLGLAAVFGTGRQELSLIYGPDLAEALVAAGDSESATGSTWYAAHQEILTSREVVTTIASAGGHRPLILRVPNPVARGALKVTGAIASLTGRATILTPDKGNELLQPAWTCSPDAFTRATGWTARHTLREGALATWQWYRQAGWI